jgi:hypothetical protein
MPIWKNLKDWISNPDVEPDFKQIVEKSLALFGVFTGVTLSFYIKDFLFVDKVPVGFMNFPLWSRTLIALAVISLLLRYIVGSAVHLNATYVAKAPKLEMKDDKLALVEEKSHKSGPLGWLFFDVLMLIGFGLLTVRITYAIDFDELMWFSIWFILVGLGWSVVAYVWRPRDRPVAERWILIDLCQVAVTWGLFLTPGYHLTKTVLLALAYIFCLFLDLCVVSRPPAAKP